MDADVVTVKDPRLLGQPVITGITQDPRAPSHLIVEVDGARFASLPAEVVYDLDLVVGQPVEDARAEKLSTAADIEAAYRVAVRLLAARPRSEGEVLRRLRDRGHHGGAAAKAIDRLRGQGLLNDEEFARHFARVRSGKGHGATRLVADLRARGVDDKTAERAVTETLLIEGVDPLARARQLAEKRAAQLGDSLSETAKRRRLIAYLGRRGYRSYEVDEIIGEVLRAPS